MKAQKIRRSLWLLNLAAAAGVVAVGIHAALYEPPPAQATTVWAEEALREYRQRQPARIVQAAVKVEDVQSVFLNPEWKERWFPYTGPRIPPKAEPPKADVEVPKGPTGLEAIGRVRMLLYRPVAAGGSVLTWEFGDKRSDVFKLGQFIAQKGQPGRFKLVDVVRLEPGKARWNLVYEVYDDPKGKPVSTGELLYDAEPKPRTDGPIRIQRKPEPAPAGGSAQAAAGAPPAPAPGSVTVVGSETAATGGGARDWKPTVRDLGRGRRRIELDEDAFAALGEKSVEKIIEDVRTEPFNEGGVRGLRVFPQGAGAIADKFDVRRGDVLISINGQPVASRDDAIRIARSIPRDTPSVSVVLDRDGERLTYDVDPRDPKVRRAAATVAPR